MESKELLSASELSALRLQAGQLLSSSSQNFSLDSHQAGWLPTSALGSGMDYAESRPYQQGDDPKNINWRLSARSTETYVKTYHMESRPSLCIVLDQRRPMIFGSRQRLKITQALRLAFLLACVADHHQLRLQFCLINQQIQWFDEQNMDSFLQQANHIALPNKENKQEGIEATFLQLDQQLTAGTFVYFISDFNDLLASHQKAMAQISGRFFIQALQVLDQTEQELAQIGKLCLQDMSRDARLFVNLDDAQQHKEINAKIEQHQKKITRALRQSGIHAEKIMADEESIYRHILLPLGH